MSSAYLRLLIFWAFHGLGGLGQMPKDMYLSLWHHREYFHCCEYYTVSIFTDLLCSVSSSSHQCQISSRPPTFPSPAIIPAAIDHFANSIILSFLECHIIGITHSIWPLQTDFFCLVCGAQWRLIFCNSMDCSPPGSSAHGIFQRRRLEWVAISCCRGSSRPRDPTCISCVSLASGFFTTAPPGKPLLLLSHMHLRLLHVFSWLL